MEFKDDDYIIYNKFMSEFTEFLFKVNDNISRDGMFYNDFLESKGLGIISLSYIGNHYKIVDHKKWTLAKIKYGI